MDSTQVFVLVVMMWTGDSRIPPLSEAELKTEFSTIDACRTVQAEFELAAKSAPEPFKSLMRYRCAPRQKKTT